MFLSEKQDIINTKIKKRIYKIIFLLSIIMAFVGIFLASYYSSINKAYDSYETTIVTNINYINEVNKNIAQFNSLQTIDVKYAKDQLPNIINRLSKIRNDLAILEPTTKYKKDNENLKLGLSSNLLIYKQALVILNNPSVAEIAGFNTKLKNYRNNCMNFYSLININNMKINLPQTTLTFVDNVLNDSYKALMTKKEKDIKLYQNQEFISKVDGLSQSFSDIKINYYSFVLKVRKKGMSYDELLSQVEGSFTKLDKLQIIFKNLSIPPSSMPTYEALKPLLDMYESYLRDFKLALTSEKIQALNLTVNPSILNTLYTSSNVKFNEIENSYIRFIKVFIELKNK